MRQICRDKRMPSRSVIYDWLDRYPEFSDLYSRACSLPLQFLGDELIDISDDATGDWVQRVGKDGTVRVVVDLDRINRDRLRVDARKWELCLLLRKYGDRSKVDTEHDVQSADQHMVESDPLSDALDAWEEASER